MCKRLRSRLAAVLWLAGSCAAQTPDFKGESEPQTAQANLQQALHDLPEGPGKQVTALACTRCHNLGGLPSYKGYWRRTQWQAMVEGMVKHGAALDDAQKQVVTDYLNSQYGRTEGQ